MGKRKEDFTDRDIRWGPAVPRGTGHRARWQAWREKVQLRGERMERPAKKSFPETEGSRKL